MALILNALCLVTSMVYGLPGSELIDGYTNKYSAYPGDSVEVFLNFSIPKNQKIHLYDLSGFNVFSFSASVGPQLPSNPKPFESGFGYKVTKRIAVPNLPSGIYLFENQIPFIIKGKKGSITVIYPLNTANAYCNSGGKSLYGFNSTDQAKSETVSLLRPIPVQYHAEAFLKWIHQQELGAGINYITDIDMEEYSSIKNSQLIIIPGHSEYWSRTARKNFDKFIYAGQNALILSGNTMWWQVRYDKSKNRMVCYKDAKKDPVKNTELKTISWSEPTLRYSIVNSIGVDFNLGGYGLKIDDGWDGFKIFKDSPLFKGTTLKVGHVLHCPSDEVDGVPILETPDKAIIQVDRTKLNFYRFELIGFDRVRRGGKDGVAAWIAMQPTSSSGVIINTGATDWCSGNGIGVNADIKMITRNMITMLLSNQPVFTGEELHESLN